MGLDIRKPIGMLFLILALELLGGEALKVMGGRAPGASIINTWCAIAFALFGGVFLWLGSRRRGQA